DAALAASDDEDAEQELLAAPAPRERVQERDRRAVVECVLAIEVLRELADRRYAHAEQRRIGDNEACDLRAIRWIDQRREPGADVPLERHAPLLTPRRGRTGAASSTASCG